MVPVYRYFYRIVVCKYRPHWFCESIQGQLVPLGNLQSMSLEVKTPTEVDICLYQNSTRYENAGELEEGGSVAARFSVPSVCDVSGTPPYMLLLPTLLTSYSLFTFTHPHPLPSLAPSEVTAPLICSTCGSLCYSALHLRVESDPALSPSRKPMSFTAPALLKHQSPARGGWK